MKNGQQVAAFERAFAEYVGARFAIALVNGTATLHTALVALGVKPGDRVAVPPLTMSATTIAVLHAGAVPVFVDVHPDTWLMEEPPAPWNGTAIPVSLYGLHSGKRPAAADLHDSAWIGSNAIDIVDAAQTLQPHSLAAFTSYSFQASKILPLGEGGMLVTDDEALATRAREFSSLGYRMRADQPRIDPDALKSPTFDRHYSLGYNYRMSDIVAEAALRQLREHEDGVSGRQVDRSLGFRRLAASYYREAIAGCDWLTPQHVPEGWTHDYWTCAVACDSPERALALSAAVMKHGGEKAYPAWRITYDEPAFAWLRPYQVNSKLSEGSKPFARAVLTLCPVAESLQPRLLQFQTNNLSSAERNAEALKKAIQEVA